MRLIAFEGLDASGKETQARLLYNELADQGYEVDAKALPQYNLSITGDLIKQALDGKITVSSKTLILLLEVEKQELQRTINDSKLELDYLIIDRYILSNLAYGAAKDIDIDWIKNIQKHYIKPDVTFLLDIPAEESYRRKKVLGKGMDLHEHDIAYLDKVRTNYLKLAEEMADTNKSDELIYVIDGTQSTETIHNEIINILKYLNF